MTGLDEAFDNEQPGEEPTSTVVQQVDGDQEDVTVGDETAGQEEDELFADLPILPLRGAGCLP
jgi:hypothetical protein